MTPYIFCGPSLPPQLARELYPEATVLGPVECGDVYLACKERPCAIGIIDGYFDHRLSVWHKEILWAISHGYPMYGAASMGALRAAELGSYGMVGVGRVFEQYRDKSLTDDDEVAVVHEPAEQHYRPRSHAMVNIRATLAAALGERLIDAAEEASLVAAGKSLFYAERTFDAVLDAAPALGAVKRKRLREWVRHEGLVDQKRADAVALLNRIRNDLESGRAVTVPVFHFETTNYWCVLQSKLDRPLHGATSSPPPPTARAAARLLEALRRDTPDLHTQVWAAALERALALLLAADGGEPDAAAVQTESERFRRLHGLLTPEETSQWLKDNTLDLVGFSHLARDQVLATRHADAARRLALEQVPSVLRALGLFTSTQKQVG